MTPIRFGPRERQLFGMLQTPSAAPRERAVLICNPFGQEAIRSHRVLRVIADQLARRGHYVLRFDYFGTGDSGGDDEDGDLAGWIDDVRAADALLRERSGCREVAWLGLRLGGSVAALAAAGRQAALSRLVLWDPVIDGPQYLDLLADAHLRAARLAYGARWHIEPAISQRAQAEAQSEALGFSLAPHLREQIAGLAPADLTAADAQGIGLLAAAGLPGLPALEQACVRAGKRVDTATTPAAIDWTTNEAMDSSIVPPEALRTVVSMLTEAA